MLVLGPQRVRAREPHLAPDLNGALQLEIGLFQHQHLIERLERDLRSAAPPEGRTSRAHVVALPIALEQIGGIDRHAQRVGELALRAVGRKPGDFHVLEVRPDPGAARQPHQIPQRHALLPRIAPRLVHHPADPDVEQALERPHGVHHDRIAVVERQGRDHDSAQRICFGGRCARRLCRLRAAVLLAQAGQRQSDVHRGPGKRPGAPLRGGQDAMDRQTIEGGVGTEAARGA